MKLSEATNLAVTDGGIVAIDPNGNYEVFKHEETMKRKGYEPLLGIIRTSGMFMVMIHIEQPNKTKGDEALIIKVLGAMLNPKLDELRDPEAKAEHDERMAKVDARIAEKEFQRAMDEVNRVYKFAEECVRMELNLRGFPKDEPMLCFGQGSDEFYENNAFYNDDDDTEKVIPVNS